MIKLAGLYLKKKENGEPYFTGSPSKDSGHNYLIFKNTKKTSDQAPDYILLIAEKNQQKPQNQQNKNNNYQTNQKRNNYSNNKNNNNFSSDDSWPEQEVAPSTEFDKSNDDLPF
jgi:single-stranded DNA-binding protein